jgi:hypothetical protein
MLKPTILTVPTTKLYRFIHEQQIQSRAADSFTSSRFIHEQQMHSPAGVMISSGLDKPVSQQFDAFVILINSLQVLQYLSN